MKYKTAGGAMMRNCLAVSVLVFGSLTCSQRAMGADSPAGSDSKPAVAQQQQAPTAPTKEELEKKFAEMMNGVTLKGHFTSDRTEGGAPGKEDQYDIESVTKMEGDYWLFKATIKYGEHNVTLPLPLEVVWAGDTPVITLDNFDVPGFGTFTARVMLFDGRYAGMWDGHGHGGVMVGKILKREAKEK
jgi:hypothetical protein